MRPITLSRQLDTADDNGIATSQTPLAAGDLTLTSTIVELDQQRKVLITPAGADAGRTFTITGTDEGGNTFSEDVSGANNPATSSSVRDFKTVTQVAVDAATAGAIEVGTSGVGASQPIKMDQLISPFNVSTFLEITGTVDVTLQYTPDDLQVDADPFNWTDHPDVTNVTTDADGTFISPVSACRLVTNSGTGTAVLKVIQAGIDG